MQLDDKFRKIADTRLLDKDIDQLIYCLGEEMAVCSDAIKQQMKPKFAEISQNAKELKFLIVQYSEASSYRFQTAKAIFEGMLRLVNEAIDLLKMADQHFVERLVNEANVALIYLKKVREAATHSELVVTTQDYSTAFLNLIKRLSKRIESGVLYPEQKQSAEQALEILKNDSVKVVDVKRNQLVSPPGNEMHSIALGTHVKSIVAAVKIVFEVARSEPKFSVDFQVDFVDDRFGFMLADLIAAVDNRDQTGVGHLLDQIAQQVANRAVETTLPPDDPKIQKTKQLLTLARDATLLCLNNRLENRGISNEITKRMEETLRQLRDAYNQLVPNYILSDRTNLRKAAQQIVANLDKLVSRAR